MALRSSSLKALAGTELSCAGQVRPRRDVCAQSGRFYYDRCTSPTSSSGCCAIHLLRGGTQQIAPSATSASISAMKKLVCMPSRVLCCWAPKVDPMSSTIFLAVFRAGASIHLVKHLTHLRVGRTPAGATAPAGVKKSDAAIPLWPGNVRPDADSPGTDAGVWYCKM